jgi:hypothetical protein
MIGLSAAEQTYRCISFEKIEARSSRFPPRLREAAVAVDEEVSVVPRRVEQGGEMFRRGDLQLLLTGLAGAEDFAGTAQAQILFGYAEAVIGFAHQGKTRARGFGQGIAA